MFYIHMYIHMCIHMYICTYICRTLGLFADQKILADKIFRGHVVGNYWITFLIRELFIFRAEKFSANGRIDHVYVYVHLRF
jgi:hypothetical protein